MQVPLESVAYFKWDEKLAIKLKTLRGKQTPQALARKVRESGIPCDKHYIVSLEDKTIVAISPALLMAIVKSLGCDFGTFLK